MGGVEKLFEEYYQNCKGVSGFVKRKILHLLFPLFKSLENEIEKNAGEIEKNASEIEKNAGEIEKNFNELAKESEKRQALEKRNNEYQLEIENAFREVEKRGTDFGQRLLTVEENVRNLNGWVELAGGKEKEINNSLEMISVQMSGLKQRVSKDLLLLKSGAAINQSGAAEQKVEQFQDSYSDIDYFDFENHFRGSTAAIKERQAEYLPFFLNKKNVIDIGCGRGEFLELLKENGVHAVGVDLYDEFVLLCKNNGLEVYQEDAIAYLKKIESTDGIFAAQLVEHLKIGQIIELCQVAFEKLEEGSCLIMETPNPTSLAIYTHAFYLDPSHEKPVHPLTLKYLAEKAGFQDVSILYTKGSKLDISIPPIGINNPEYEKFNESMAVVSEYMFGSQDYAVIARK